MRKSLWSLCAAAGVFVGGFTLVHHVDLHAGQRDDSPNLPPTAEKAKPADEKPAATTEAVEKVLLSGEVLLLPEVFRRKGVKSYADEIEKQVVLLTSEGDVVPLVPDWRGRAFFQDERLRGRPVELIVNRRPGVPWVSVLSIYARDEKDKRVVVDYWCDVCSIPMYEIKECECCQGPIRLRYRPQSLPKDVKSAKKSGS